ncbi:glycosyltransferase family 28 c-terminal domain-containing protein [Cystoisospora suis]|uniref:UDP-N-acetylglucosamine transferase subunit ALG13 n=1 Tax=Cystoisospora suis TaxID=483139 RepID=A0A2C6KRS3_9APIC|nr:glycosyltransferase family 28 c-terminal domain-containing protein [Cystoisospora suis]
MDAEGGASSVRQGANQPEASLPPSSLTCNQSFLKSPQPGPPGSLSASFSPWSLSHASPRASSFVPRRVLVTVGTTSFDSLLSTVLQESFLELLFSLGCRSLTLQVGRGDVPSLFSRFFSLPQATQLKAFPSPNTSAANLPKSPCHSRKRSTAKQHGIKNWSPVTLPGFELNSEEEITTRTPFTPPACHSAPGNAEGAFTLFFENGKQEGSASHDPTSRKNVCRVTSLSPGTISAPSVPLASPDPSKVFSSDPQCSSDALSISYFRFKPSLEDDLRKADVVISHCGAGTVLQTLRFQKRLVAVVNKTLMNNHQLELGEELQRRGHCLLVTRLEPISTSTDQEGEASSLTGRPTLITAAGRWLYSIVRGYDKGEGEKKQTDSETDGLYAAFRRICEAEWVTVREECFSFYPSSPCSRPVCLSPSVPSPRTGRSLMLVPLPEPDLKGFYTVVEEVAGVNPLW